MIVHCIRKLADSWHVPLSADSATDDRSDCWNLTYGNFNRKRYYIMAHEMTMWSVLLFELSPKNFAKKVSEKLMFWSSYYGLPDLTKPPFFNTAHQVFCKNSDKSVTGMITRLREDLWYYFDCQKSVFEIELLMHKWIFLPMKEGFPIDYLNRFVESKRESQIY